MNDTCMTAATHVINALQPRCKTRLSVKKDVYRVTQNAKYGRNIFFVKICINSPASYLCGIRENDTHVTPGRVSYTVNIQTGKVSQKCFSSKCQLHFNGAMILVQPSYRKINFENDVVSEVEDSDEDENALIVPLCEDEGEEEDEGDYLPQEREEDDPF